ncbi:MAG TPA: Ni/Fe hydrogenase subunit alpha [Candidatus Bipolaricaulota bacterium]|nr:Ni/Fe hydrogenase subunit alpha [Candidatus Bipolaricaulota bacterium]
MKTIKINHIAKTEGHSSFVGSLLGGEAAEARLITEEGARLFEGMVIGRPYQQLPVIVSRICGVCPIVHNLGAIKAIENAFFTEITPEIILLRKILELAQIIHSHALHMFFLSFPDFVGVSNNTDLVKKYPEQSKYALEVRDFGVLAAKIIGGRTIHPINSVVGGFNVAPDENSLKELAEIIPVKTKQAVKLFDFLKKQKITNFKNPSNYVALKSGKEYAIYDGEVFFLDNKRKVSADQFYAEVSETNSSGEAVKRSHHLGRAVMCGSLARINCNYDKLNGIAKKNWDELGIETPDYNPFHNVLAQSIEIIHCLEECGKLIEKYLKIRNKKLKVSVKPAAGRGLSVIEAPRGLLYYNFDFDDYGAVRKCDIVTPTALFIANLEKDLKVFLPTLQNFSDKKRESLIKSLIRAYDPCISCATH